MSIPLEGIDNTPIRVYHIPDEPLIVIHIKEVPMPSVKALNAFVRQTYRLWDPYEKILPVPVFRDPVRLNWESEASTRHPEAFGEYSLNPTTQGLNFSRIPPKQFEVLELPDFVGKLFWQVGAHLVKTYNSTHAIPGVELWSHLFQNERRASEILHPPQWNWRGYFLFGSLIRLSGGSWDVPSASWSGAEWNPNRYSLGDDWDAKYRVVLVKLSVAR